MKSATYQCRVHGNNFHIPHTFDTFDVYTAMRFMYSNGSVLMTH